MNYDVVVIGGGIVGTGILHKLSQFDLKIALLEKEPDLAEGISKANSAIIHTGFDAPPHSLEAEALKRSRTLWPDLVKNHHLMFEKRGAVMVALNQEEKEIIMNKYIKNAEENGVEVKWISREEVLERNPVVNPDNIGGLLISDESIIDPWEAVYKFAEVAQQNGADVLLNSGVKGISDKGNVYEIQLEDDRVITSEYIINAAGLFADDIARMVGDDTFTITPRKGQFFITKSKVNISNIVLPVPTPTSKGKLVIPAVFKGHLLGPTAEDHNDKYDLSTNKTGFEEIRRETSKLIPESIDYHSVKQYSGNRSVCSENDFVIRPAKNSARLIHAAGIRSTGLSASPGIGEMIAEELEKVGLTLTLKSSWQAEVVTPTVQSNDEEIICLTRNITRAQIINALSKDVSPKNIDGLKRRTTVILGECQGSCCIPKIMDIMEELVQEESSVKKDKRSAIGIKLSK